MNDSLISIVIPIYDVADCLSRCIDSIVSQLYTNIQIILIDDGSPDNSGEICDQYAQIDNRIIVRHIPNSGVAKARQLGVNISVGEFIIFVDPDDYLPSNAISLMCKEINGEVDLIAGAHTLIFRNKEIIYRATDAKMLDNLTLYILRKEINHAPWAKMFRRTLFEADSFPNFRKSQDWLMFIELSTRVRKTIIIPQSVYYHCSRASSTVNTFKGDLNYWLSYMAMCKDILEKNKILNTYYSSFNVLKLICASRVPKLEQKDQRIQQIIKEQKYFNLPKQERMKYIRLKYTIIDSIYVFVQKIWHLIHNR